LADAGITGGELGAGFEGSLLPEAREVEDAQRTGDAGADERNVGIAHGKSGLFLRR
jgi:hypothetical protein